MVKSSTHVNKLELSFALFISTYVARWKRLCTRRGENDNLGVMMMKIRPTPIFAPRRLRAIRERRGTTRYELAQLMGCTRQTIRNWEEGATQPRSDALIGLADVLHVEIGELVDYE